MTNNALFRKNSLYLYKNPIEHFFNCSINLLKNGYNLDCLEIEFPKEPGISQINQRIYWFSPTGLGNIHKSQNFANPSRDGIQFVGFSIDQFHVENFSTYIYQKKQNDR